MRLMCSSGECVWVSESAGPSFTYSWFGGGWRGICVRILNSRDIGFEFLISWSKCAVEAGYSIEWW